MDNVLRFLKELNDSQLQKAAKEQRLHVWAVTTPEESD